MINKKELQEKNMNGRFFKGSVIEDKNGNKYIVDSIYVNSGKLSLVGKEGLQNPNDYKILIP